MKQGYARLGDGDAGVVRETVIHLRDVIGVHQGRRSVTVHTLIEASRESVCVCMWVMCVYVGDVCDVCLCVYVMHVCECV